MASCPPPTDNDVYVQCGDAEEESERVKVEVVAGVGHEAEKPDTEDFYSDGSSRVGCLDEENEITCAQTSVEADMYSQCAHLKQSEKKKVQTETEEHGENMVTKELNVKIIEEEIRPLKVKKMKGPLPNKRTLAANLGAGSHQRQPAFEIKDNTTERTKKLTRGLYVKIIEEEIQTLKVKKDERPKT